jgi:hypothetical protein
MDVELEHGVARSAFALRATAWNLRLVHRLQHVCSLWRRRGRRLCDALAVRKAFAHDATVRLASGGDDGAPGAAITVALCGHWEHEPPCPLAPHDTRAEPTGDELRLRILFAVEPELEDEVRQRIDGALASSQLVGPDGAVTTWELHGTQRGDVLEAELDHAGRLMRRY